MITPFPHHPPSPGNPGDSGGISRIRDLLERRAAAFLASDHLHVDYYRIRHKLAFPLPLRAMPRPGIPVRGIPRYPWSIWMAWALEERLFSLGWSGEWSGNRETRDAAVRDLCALADWPAYREYADLPSLCLAHCARTLWAAARNWEWLGDEARSAIRKGLGRIVSEAYPRFEETFAGAEEKLASLGGDPAALKRFHNIVVIETLALGLAARETGDPRRETVDRTLVRILATLLDLRFDGYTEGVAYDGYVMDFAADWFATQPADSVAPLLSHPRFSDLFRESCYLAVPGNAAHVAELSDVEPRGMPFHLSAHAKLAPRLRMEELDWYLGRCPLDWIRADGLAALAGGRECPAPARPPRPGVLDACYATALRSGWERDDLCVAAASSASPMGHIHFDKGSLVLGTRGHWLLADPGYQQYMKTSERTFTVGPSAHNAPVINGLAQDRKTRAPAVPGNGTDDVPNVFLDLTDCYPEESRVTRVWRRIWLVESRWVVVGDRVEGDGVDTIAYHWHGHPDAWWNETPGSWTLVHADAGTLELRALSPEPAETVVSRLPGSRGHLTLRATFTAPAPVIWWVLTSGKPFDKVEAPELRPDGNDRIHRDRRLAVEKPE